jgi:hypothetical protein
MPIHIWLLNLQYRHSSGCRVCNATKLPIWLPDWQCHYLHCCGFEGRYLSGCGICRATTRIAAVFARPLPVRLRDSRGHYLADGGVAGWHSSGRGNCGLSGRRIGAAPNCGRKRRLGRVRKSFFTRALSEMPLRHDSTQDCR